MNAGSIIWALKRFRGYLWGTNFRIFSDRKALESIGKVGNHISRVHRWLEFLIAFDYTLECRKGSANGSAYFPLARAYHGTGRRWVDESQPC